MIVHTANSPQAKGAFYSAFLLIALVVTFLLGLLAHYNLPVANPY